MNSTAAPRLPPLAEFTPDQIGGFENIFGLLDIVWSASGKRDDVVERIRARWFSESAEARLDPQEQLTQQHKRAGNVVSGMRALGLLTVSVREPELSALGVHIRSLKGDPGSATEAFARFLLRERRGIELLEIARAVRRRDGRVTNGSVNAELTARGYAIPTNSANAGKLRQWMEAAGVVDSRWNIAEERFAELAGVSAQEISEWRKLTKLQQSTIELLRIRAKGNRLPISSPDLLDLLRQRSEDFDGGQVKRDIYLPLSASGWIDHFVAPGGRGGKGGTVSPTDKALQLDVDLIDGLDIGELPADLQEHLGRPLPEVMNELASPDTYAKGIALELLSLRMASDCGLMPVELRVRGIATGGAEVDLVAEGAHLHFSRWLFQCKNQVATVGLDVLAKELGMATLLRAQVVVIVTTAKFAKSVVDFARQAAESTAIQVVLIDGTLLKRYGEHGPAALRDELHSRAAEILTLKRPQLADVPKE